MSFIETRNVQTKSVLIAIALKTGIDIGRLQLHEQKDPWTPQLVHRLMAELEAGVRKEVQTPDKIYWDEAPKGWRNAGKWFLSEVLAALGLEWWKFELHHRHYVTTTNNITQYICPHTKKHREEVHTYYLAGEACYEGSRQEWEDLRMIADSTVKVTHIWGELPPEARRALVNYEFKDKGKIR